MSNPQQAGGINYNGNIDLFGDKIEKNALLRDKFIEPPFSILDTKTGDWQRRKRQWKELGIESEKGREEKLLGNGSGNSDEQDNDFSERYGRKITNGVGIFDNATSIFDPALCELMYRWFCPPGGKILDSFAGGSVRGIVANYLGYKYTGVELRNEQVQSNLEQAQRIMPGNIPNWINGDTERVLGHMAETNVTYESFYDFAFTCPPYHDLEVYSDDPNDLSNMPYEQFKTKYAAIIKHTVHLLRPNSFAAIVVGDIRDKNGFYKNFNGFTKEAFLAAGCKLYNEAKLLQPLGTAMLRANRIFGTNRKLIKVHEDVLIFYKGGPENIRERFKNSILDYQADSC